MNGEEKEEEDDDVLESERLPLSLEVLSAG